MKKVFLFLFALLHYNMNGQVAPNAQKIFEDGLNYVSGINKNFNPNLAKQLFIQSANMGNVNAMYKLGDFFTNSIYGKPNKDSAIYWFKAAARLGNDTAYFKLGKMYKQGKAVLQDFNEAVKYYKQGVKENNILCKNALAYMLYKGFGIVQNYDEAFKLFEETAELGNNNSMYFLGLCYKNGYGINADQEKASNWLNKASLNFSIQAETEMEEILPENVSIVDPSLQKMVKDLNSKTEKFTASNANNYEGSYQGYAIYYDWSGKYISEVLPLIINLQKNANGYSGNWKEGENENVELSITNDKNLFTLNNKTPYTRINHYSGRETEMWKFKNAKLNLSFQEDSIVLNGYVQFYSLKRREPSKPFQIVVKKVMDGNVVINNKKINIKIFPNPTQDNANVEIELKKITKLSFRVVSQNGTVLYNELPKLLPKGTYTYQLPTLNFTAGIYSVQLLSNDVILNSKIFIKQ